MPRLLALARIRPIAIGSVATGMNARTRGSRLSADPEVAA